MNSINQFSITYTRDDNTCAWIARNALKGTYSAEIMVRVEGGIRYRDLEYGSELPTIRRLRADALECGFFSRRPFRLGEPVDPTMTDCVLALFAHLCASRRLDARRLVQPKFPGTGFGANQDMTRIIEQAKWEGLVYPQTWDAALIHTLARALDDICYEVLGEWVALQTRVDRS